MKYPTFLPLLVGALLFGACSEATDPEPENVAGSFQQTATEGIVVPDDGSIVVITGLIARPAVLEGPQANLSSGDDFGHLGMSCTLVTSSRRCFLLWIGATATTTVAIATCTSGVFTAGCAGAIIGAAYTWDQFLQEPDCRPCRDPFDLRTGGYWYRERNTQ
jgi:hypothetical protein